MRTRRTSSSDPVSSGNKKEEKIPVHRSVLLHEVIASLALQKDSVVLDGTLGGAGHARELCKKISTQGTFIGLDSDRAAIARAHEALAQCSARIILRQRNFRFFPDVLAEMEVEKLDAAFFDLGWSSYQLSAGRGFSFRAHEPLSMAYDESQRLTAATIVNEWDEENIADVLFGWGDERFARRIARAIVARREIAPIAWSDELADLVSHATPSWYRKGRIHPATKTFQALRIAVNDEMGALRETLAHIPQYMQSKGRCACITFHSTEDRIVKKTFVQWEKERRGAPLTKKPMIPSAEELQNNPRARSAKLRVFVFI